MSHLRGFGTIAMGRLLLIAAQIASIRALTTFLSPEEAGRTYIILSLFAAFSLVLVSPISTYIDRCLLDWIRQGVARLRYRNFVRYLVLVGSFSVGVVVLIYESARVWLDIALFSVAAMLSGNLLFGSIGACMLSGLNIIGRRGAFVVLSNVLAWGGIAMAIVLMNYFAATAETWIAGHVVAQVFVAAAAAIVFWRLLGPTTVGSGQEYTVSGIGQVFRFAWPLALGIFLFWIQTQSYRLILSYVVNAEAVGFFAVGFAIGAGLMVAFEILFTQFYQPLYYGAIMGQDSQGRTEAWNTYASAYLPTIVVVAAFVAFGGPYLVTLFASKQFEGIAAVVTWAALIEAIRMVSGAYYMAALAEMDTRVLVIPSFVGAIIATIGVFILGDWEPLHGTGLALCLGALSNMIGITITLRKKMRFNLPWRRLGYAVVLALPLAAIFLGARKIVPTGDLPGAGVVLAIASAYMLCAQGGLARRWLIAKSST